MVAGELVAPVRMLKREPGFSAFVIGILGLGMGGALMAFNTLQAGRSLPPVRDLNRIYVVSMRNPQAGVERQALTPQTFEQLRDLQVFERVAASVDEGEQLLRTQNLADTVSLRTVSDGYFDLLGREPLLGRLPSLSAGGPSNTDIVLSHACWRRFFSEDPAAVGRMVQLNGIPHTIVAVMPRDFWFPPGDVDLWKPVTLATDDGSTLLFVTGRVARIEDANRVRAGLRVLGDRVSVAGIRTGRWQINSVALADQLQSRSVQGAIVLLAPAAVVLLVACANVALMTIARGVRREPDVAIRRALGATASAIVREQLAEVSMLAIASGAGGLAIGALGTRLLASQLPTSIGARVHFELAAFGVVVGLVALALFASGILPALRAARFDMMACLKRSAVGAKHRRGRFGFTDLFVLLQVAIAAGLALTSLMLFRFVWQLQHVAVRFDTQDLYVARVHLPPARFPSPSQRAMVADAIAHQVAATPGVGTAAVATRLPSIAGGFEKIDIPGGTTAFHVEALGELVTRPIAMRIAVSPGYFEALGLAVRHGRAIDAGDVPGAPHAAVVSRTAAAMFWPSTDPLGQQLAFSRDDRRETLTVVGIAEDALDSRALGLPALYVYTALAQHPNVTSLDLTFRWVGTAGENKLSTIRNAVARVDPGVPLDNVRTVGDALTTQWQPQTVIVSVVGGSAFVAILLAVAGVYAQSMHAVLRRVQEIGLRMALGASARAVIWPVLRDGILLSVLGATIGIGIAAWITYRQWAALLQLTIRDPVVWLVAVLLIGASTLSFLAPARTAARVDPMIALRYE